LQCCIEVHIALFLMQICKR